MAEILKVQQIDFDYGSRPLLKNLSLEVLSGELLGILGPNGAGKTTLIKLLCGLLRPASGEVLLRGRTLESLKPRERAKAISLVPQDTVSGSSFTVRDVAAMGRSPHLGRFGTPAPADQAATEQALEGAELTELACRRLNELSSGEQKLAFIARALAQQTDVILLDEPTSNLDLAHQLSLMHLLRRLAAEGRAVVLSMHDLSLAATYCDRVALLRPGRAALIGPPQEVVTEESLSQFFGVSALILRHGASVSIIPEKLR